MTIRRALTALIALPAAAVTFAMATPATQAQAATSANRTVYTYFVNKGLTPAQAAGIAGNFMIESGSPINPRAVQWGGLGRGIGQWSVGGRWNSDYHDNLYWFARVHHSSVWSLQTQLDFTWYELNYDSTYGLRQLRATRSSKAATVSFMRTFEMCGNCATSLRVSSAAHVLSSYGG